MAQLYYFGSPKADFLLTLIQFNVFRALLQNTTTLDIPFDWLHDVADSAIVQGLFNPTAPSSLQPTALQRKLPHHPWSDLFPFPRLRDNILQACDGRVELEDALCSAMVGWCNSPSTRVGIIVWGEPCDPSGWEVTEGFCKNWGWLMSGCGDLIESSNRWRKVRDEKPLVLEQLQH
ncbi:hypothetical protein BDV96DRAFT_644608 [Lophiotrema nucula]|uniref:Uncharacterized protein n=1 Tax=Lophiotrema nucula TaxID=690887 RepID=A0A6A5ZD91_9PLEO|nr:hypothetical protein BDV96DRAFT_644608 [Lophiotrema nucula]